MSDDALAQATQIAAMAALANTGVLDALCEAPSRPEDLAKRFQLNEPALGRALEVARALGFLQKIGSEYQSNNSRYMPGALVLSMARQFSQHLQTGESLSQSAGDRAQMYQVATPMLAKMFGAAAEQLAEALANLPGEAILDVGAGSGVWSIAMANHQSNAVVSALDFEPVLKNFRESARHISFECIAGNYHEVELAPQWDRVVLANVLHLEKEECARSLLARAASWCREHGRVIIVDIMYRTQDSDLAMISYELHLALRVQGGRVYDASTLAAWAGELGLQVESSIVLDHKAGMGALVLK